MAKGEDITTRFRVDISDLKKGISEANNQIKIANSVFKSASNGTKEWANSSDGLKAKLTQLKSVLEAQTAKLNSYKQQLSTAQKYEKEATTNVNNLKSALDKAKSSYGANSSEVKKLQTQLTQAEKAEMQMKNQVTALTVSMNNQQGTVNATSSQINKLEGSLKRVEQAERIAAKTGKSVDEVLTEMDKAARKTKDGFTVMKGALANLVASGIRSAISGVQSLVGEAINASDALYKFEQTMAFAGYDNSSIQKAKTEMKQYADETVYDLNTISNTTAQLAANGIQDYTGLTKAAGNLNAVAGGNADTFKSVALVLTQTAGAGKLTTENWNQLANAIPGASGKIQEALLKNGAYTGNFREAMEKGEITAEEFNQAIMQLGNEPVAVEAAKSVQTFEGAIGNMQAAVVDGLMKIIDTIGMENITGFINSVTSGIQALIPHVQNIFSFVVEHGKAIAVVLGAIITAFAVSQIVSGITTVRTAMLILNGTMLATQTSTSAVTLANNLQTASLIAQKIAMVASTTATKGVTAAQWLWNAALTANPIGLVVVAIAALIAAIAALTIHFLTEEKAIKSTEEAQEALTEATKEAKEAEDTYIDSIDRATEAQKKLEEAEKATGLSGKALYEQVKNGTLNYADMSEEQRKVYKAYLENDEAQKQAKESTEKFNEAKKKEQIASYENQLALAKESDSYDEFKKSVVDAFNKGELSADEARDLIGKSMSEMSRDSQKTFMEDIPSDIKDGLNPKNYETDGQKLKKWFGSRWQDIKNTFSDAGSWFGTKFGEAKTAIQNKWSDIGSWFSKKKEEIKNAFKSISNDLGNKFNEAKNTIKNKFSPVTSFFSETMTKVKKTVNNKITEIKNKVKDIFKNITPKLNLKLPKVSVSGGEAPWGIGGKGKLPSFKVTWNRLGGVFDSPTIFGGSRGFQGLGEDGAEAVVPLERNKYWIGKVADEMLKQLQVANTSNGINNLTNNNTNNYTQIINAPKQPSRIELYRQTKNLLNLKGGY